MSSSSQNDDSVTKKDSNSIKFTKTLDKLPLSNPIQINIRIPKSQCPCTGENSGTTFKEKSDIRPDGLLHAFKIDSTGVVADESVKKFVYQTLEASAKGASGAPGRSRRNTITKSDLMMLSKSDVPIKKLAYSVHTVRSHLGRSIKDPNGMDWSRTYWFGEKGSGFKTKSGEAQDFYMLRDEHLRKGTLFEDPEFPPNNVSLFASNRAERRFSWKRPGQICSEPQLFVGGFSRFDVQQGELGDCWLLAATANLTMYRKLFFQIVPDDQSFDDKYAGIFHFRFWQYGRWLDVVIDDLLPTEDGKLVYLHSSDDNEFWSALLEKAYAKLHGSYEALKGGSTCEAMEDFTGGVTEMYELDNSVPNLFKILVKGYERASLMGCSLEPDPNVLEAETAEGLIRGHAYSITKVVYVDVATPNVSGKIPLLRLRNPWGNEVEWKGAWSDGAPEWKYISENDKNSLGILFDEDGEFWMSFKDWEKHFDRLEICNLNPDSLSERESQSKKKWEMSIFEGAWVKGITAGGCRNFLETFWNNPQYRITLTEVDEDDEDNKCTCIVALMQKNRRQIKTASGEDLLTMGFALYFLPSPSKVPKPLDLNFFKYNASVARSPSFINLREVSCRFKLPPGTYCIVPSTYEPNEEGEFLLRVFSEHRNNMQEHDATLGFRTVDDRIGVPKKVAKIHAEKVRAKQDEEDLKKRALSMSYFDLVAGGSDNEIGYLELKDLLEKSLAAELKGESISTEICRCMVSMMDYNYNGRLDREEFLNLWDMIAMWKKAFRLYDVDNTGSLSGFELRNALESAGYSVTNHVLNILMHRYGNHEGEITIDLFILCAVRLKTMLDKFEARQEENLISLTREEWIESTIYC